jgi:hypothetical protein
LQVVEQLVLVAVVQVVYAAQLPQLVVVGL